MLVSVRLGSVKFYFFTVNCPTAKNPRAVFPTLAIEKIKAGVFDGP